jgi:hypothetical protein
MIRIRTGTILFSVFLLCASAGWGQVDLRRLGQSTMNFQLVSISARASALGEAVYATTGGAEAIFYNPAGMIRAPKSVDAGLWYTGWIADIAYMGGAAVWNAGDIGSIGVSALWVDYGTINATRLVAASSQSEAVVYEDAGKMQNVAAYAFGLSYGRAINEQFALGATVRYTGQNLGESVLAGGLTRNNASQLAFDMGVTYLTGYRSLRFGMAIRNFSSQVKREEISEQLPMTFTLGGAMDLLDVVDPEHDRSSGLTLGVDYLHPNNYSERFNFGLEYLMFGMVALRGGYQTNRDLASWSAGVGLLTTYDGYDVQVHYSYSAFEYFNGVHRFSIGFSL